jgi:hypothetical protein
LLIPCIDTATTILSALRDRERLSQELESQLDRLVKHTLPLPSSSTNTETLQELDVLGCDLWNATTNILRGEEEHGQPATSSHARSHSLLATLRAFAFLLLDTVYRSTGSRSKSPDERIRNFKVGLKACRFCLDNSDLELAQKILESCADYANVAVTDSPLIRTSHESNEASERKSKLAVLISQYYLLRMTHASKAQRLDLAEHFYSKFLISTSGHASELAEMSANLCHDAGKALSRAGFADDAIKCQDRALAALDGCDVEHLSFDASELRLSITSALGW